MIGKLMAFLRSDYLVITVNRKLLFVALAVLGFKGFYHYAYNKGAEDAFQYLLQKMNAPEAPASTNS